MILAGIAGILSPRASGELSYEYEQESRDEESSLEMLSFEYELEVRVPPPFHEWDYTFRVTVKAETFP